MNFTVTYRKNDGALATEVIDAADRAAVIAACRARGIVPTSVTQGGRHAPSKPRNPSWLKGAIAGVLVAVIAGGALWWFGRGEATPPTKEKPKKVKVEVAQGAYLNLAFTGTNTVASLNLGGESVMDFANATTHPEFICGMGTLVVRPTGTMMLFR